MNEQHLIAHKYCGQPTFDVATQMKCPICELISSANCAECDDGYWWILNDGHRAHPYWHCSLDPKRDLIGQMLADSVPPMPNDARDAYPEPRKEPAEKPQALRGLLTKIGLLPKLERRL
jgi:hypothetical protein